MLERRGREKAEEVSTTVAGRGAELLEGVNELPATMSRAVHKGWLQNEKY